MAAVQAILAKSGFRRKTPLHPSQMAETFHHEKWPPPGRISELNKAAAIRVEARNLIFMRKIKCLLLVFLTVILLPGLLPSRAFADSAPAAPPTAKPPAPGTELAKAISKITGVAISPLFGASAIGAWKYAETPPEARAKLPWYAQPWFWVPAFVIVGL